MIDLLFNIFMETFPYIYESKSPLYLRILRDCSTTIFLAGVVLASGLFSQKLRELGLFCIFIGLSLCLITVFFAALDLLLKKLK